MIPVPSSTCSRERPWAAAFLSRGRRGPFDYLADQRGTYTWQQVPTSLRKLPLITLAGGSHTQPILVPLAIPTPPQNITGGELFIFVGAVNAGLRINSDGSVAAPKAISSIATPAPAPDNLAQFKFTYRAFRDPPRRVSQTYLKRERGGFPRLEGLAVELGLLVASAILEDEATRLCGRRYER